MRNPERMLAVGAIVALAGVVVYQQLGYHELKSGYREFRNRTRIADVVENLRYFDFQVAERLERILLEAEWPRLYGQIRDASLRFQDRWPIDTESDDENEG